MSRFPLVYALLLAAWPSYSAQSASVHASLASASLPAIVPLQALAPSSDAQGLAAVIRQGATLAADEYARTQNPFSPLRGPEAPRLEPLAALGRHVVSLGSGPDVFRPLVDFPLATEYHLVDVLRGWGAGPGHVVYEVLHRLEFLAGPGNVKVVEPGFLEHLPAELVAAPKNPDERHSWPAEYQSRWPRRPDLREPLVLEARWSPAPGLETVKRFLVHPLDYQRPTHIAQLFSQIPQEGLAGALVTGAPMPKARTLELLAERLAREGGTFVVEAYLHWPEFARGLKRLSQRFSLEALETEERTRRMNMRFEPVTYVAHPKVAD